MSQSNTQNTFLLKCTIVAALGGLLFGFDTAVISGTEQTLKVLFSGRYLELTKLFGTENFWHGLAVASALIGTIIGAISFGKLADTYGRRYMLYILSLLYFISSIGSGLAGGFESFMLFRFVGGLAVGGSSVISPMYIAEISPAKSRGRMVAITQFNIVLGILLAFVSNYIISTLNLGENAWRWMLGVQAIPALAFFLLLFKIPESPRWLLSKGDAGKAEKVLQLLGNDISVQDEIAEIQRSLNSEKDSMREPFKLKKYMKPISMGVLIAAFNQLSGINAIMYFAPRIFSMSGFDKSAAFLGSIGVGIVNLFVTMGALLIIDKFGRKKLMLWGSLGYLVSLGIIALTFYGYDKEFGLVKALQNGTDKALLASAIDAAASGGKIVMFSLFLFVAAHAFGQGTVIWVFISEIFPTNVRARGVGLASTSLWVMAAAVSWTFPIFAEKSGANLFGFYWICMLAQLIWVIFVMPETKGISLEDMQKKLNLNT